MTSIRFAGFCAYILKRRATRWSRPTTAWTTCPRLRRGGIDLALVDVMLPELDGFEVVRRIRSESGLPIILITARGEEAQRIAVLEVGADDYVVKPFSAPEVVARVRAQLRRARGHFGAQEPLRIGSVDLDEEARRVSVDGREVELTRREFDLLAALLRDPDRVRTRDALLERVGVDLPSARQSTCTSRACGANLGTP